jgi:RimJ/RimL family protein N-acetyltransferase
MRCLGDVAIPTKHQVSEMDHYRKLVGDKCYLSPCASGDAAKWTVWFNDLEVTLPLGDEAYTPAGYTRMEDDLTEIVGRREHIFSIVDSATDELIGRGMLFSFDVLNRTAMLGIVIGEKRYWGQGYGQDAVRLLLDYGFNLLNLNNIMLGVLGFNQRAIGCYEKVGFKLIGRRRQARILAGKAYDLLMMDILAEEFSGSRVAALAAEAGGHAS